MDFGCRTVERREVMHQVVLNERLKLIANFFNTVAAAILTTGVVAPIISFVFGFAPKNVDPALVLTTVLICGLVSYALHLGGRSILGGLQP
jgi:hypothetical protein